MSLVMVLLVWAFSLDIAVYAMALYHRLTENTDFRAFLLYSFAGSLVIAVPMVTLLWHFPAAGSAQ